MRRSKGITLIANERIMDNRKVERMHVWGITEGEKLVGIIVPVPGGQTIYLTERANAEEVAEIINGGVIPLLNGEAHG